MCASLGSAVWDDTHDQRVQPLTHRIIFDFFLPLSGLGRIRGNAKLRTKRQTKCRIVTVTLHPPHTFTPHTYTSSLHHTHARPHLGHEAVAFVLAVGRDAKERRLVEVVVPHLRPCRSTMFANVAAMVPRSPCWEKAFTRYICNWCACMFRP